MKSNVFITQTAGFLPNEPVDNDHMEEHLGLIAGNKSKARAIVLRNNGIKSRYYALTTEQQITHSNAEMAAEAIRRLFPNNLLDNRVDILSCGTSTPDQLLPSHASMTHGELKCHPLEINSFSGVCLTSLQALKSCYYAVSSGNARKAVCCASELTSPALLSRFYDPDYDRVEKLKEDPYMAFEKDFMRFMLSDGAGAVLLQNNPTGKINFKIEWIDICSYAGELPTCMFMASELQPDGRLKGWKEFSPEQIKDRAVMVGKQDIRALKKYIISYWVDHIQNCLAKHDLNPSEVDYVIPHVSSMFFYKLLDEALKAKQIDLPENKWFTNLCSVGNIGSAAIFVALDELACSGKLVKGNKIVLLVPESGRFSYGTVLLTVV